MYYWQSYFREAVNAFSKENNEEYKNLCWQRIGNCLWVEDQLLTSLNAPGVLWKVFGNEEDDEDFIFVHEPQLAEDVDEAVEEDEEVDQLMNSDDDEAENEAVPKKKSAKVQIVMIIYQ